MFWFHSLLCFSSRRRTRKVTLVTVSMALSYNDFHPSFTLFFYGRSCQGKERLNNGAGFRKNIICLENHVCFNRRQLFQLSLIIYHGLLLLEPCLNIFEESLLVPSSILAIILPSFFVTVVNGHLLHIDHSSLGLSDELLQLGLGPAKKLHLRMATDLGLMLRREMFEPPRVYYSAGSSHERFGVSSHGRQPVCQPCYI